MKRSHRLPTSAADLTSHDFRARRRTAHHRSRHQVIHRNALLWSAAFVANVVVFPISENFKLMLGVWVQPIKRLSNPTHRRIDMNIEGAMASSYQRMNHSATAVMESTRGSSVACSTKPLHSNTTSAKARHMEATITNFMSNELFDQSSRALLTSLSKVPNTC